MCVCMHKERATHVYIRLGVGSHAVENRSIGGHELYGRSDCEQLGWLCVINPALPCSLPEPPTGLSLKSTEWCSTTDHSTWLHVLGNARI